MATIRKRGNRWQAQVRRDGFRCVSKSFHNKEDAHKWSRQTEAAIERGETAPSHNAAFKHVSCILLHYLESVTPLKRGNKEENYRIKAMLKDTLASQPIDRLTSQHIADYRDRRLLRVTPPSVRRELVIIRHALEIARLEWGCSLQNNPAAVIRMPSHARPRERRLSEEELDKLIKGAEDMRCWWMKPTIELALETGMRRGELLNAKWEDLSADKTILTIPMTKNGEARRIPLSAKARTVLENIKRDDRKMFPMSANALRLAWERLKRAKSIDDLRFHDLRHEAISRLFERGLSLPEVALISGHKDPRMLFRYTHLRAEDVVSKLND